MTFLNLFPLPRRYERVPGALAFTLAAAMAILFFKERTMLAAGLLLGSLILLVLVYIIRFRQREEWQKFFTDENRRLLAMRGAEGPARYIPVQKELIRHLRNPELKLTALLNLSTALLADANPEEALKILSGLTPEKMPNPTLRLVYWTQEMESFIQLHDEKNAQTAYQAAISTLPEVSDMLKISFMPAEIQYRLFRKDYELVLNQLGEIPANQLDEASKDLLTVLRIRALYGVGAGEKAEKLLLQVQKHDLLPSTRALLADQNAL